MPKPIREIRIDGNIAHVPLTRGYEAVIDAVDAHLVSGFNWYASVDRRADGSIRSIYAVRKRRDENGREKGEHLHRVIAGATCGLEVDHKDGDGLSNRRSNIRLATNAQNQHNQRLSARNTSGAKGVTWHRQRGKWQAQIVISKKRKYLGCFSTVSDASRAYHAAAVSAFGEWANLGVAE